MVEIKILDAIPKAFREAQAAAVEQVRHELIFTRLVVSHRSEEPLDFRLREHRGEALGPVGSFDGADVVERPIEHIVVKKDDGIERLILGGSRDVALRGQIIEERLHVRGSEVARMGGVMELDESLDPPNVGPFGV